VADIISIDEKLKAVKDFEAARLYQRKLVAVRQTVQCAQCRLKCEKCGAHLQPGSGEAATDHPSFRVPYRFCDFCAQEYVDYVERMQGRGDPGCYWQNAAWRDAWGRWISYRGALDSFSKTPEFARLLAEVRTAPPEE
jgi:hypothetical protein